MSENEQQSQTNDKQQGTVITYLRCGGTVNNQMKTFVKLMNIWHSYGQKSRLCRALSSCGGEAHHLACNVFKYSPILEIFH